MHSLKYYVLLISLIVVVLAGEIEKEKEKSQDLERTGTNYAASGKSNCDTLARLLTAYASNAKASSDYSATAPNYAAPISALYGMINAAQNHAGHSSHSVPASSSYSTPATGYSSMKPAAGYSSSSSSAKPTSGYSSGGSSYSAPSSGGSGYSYTSSSPSSSAKPSGYTAPASSSGYSAPASSSGYSAPASSSGYSAPASSSGYSSGSASYKPATGGSTSAYSSHSGRPSSYERYSDMASYMNREGFAQPPMDAFHARNYYANPQQHALAYNMKPTFYNPASYNFENERSAYESSKHNDATKQAPTSGSYTAQNSQPASASYTAEKPNSDSVPQSYSRYGSAHSPSASYGEENSAVPVPVCAQNYLLSCESSVQTVPCVHQSQGYSAKY